MSYSTVIATDLSREKAGRHLKKVFIFWTPPWTIT